MSFTTKTRTKSTVYKRSEEEEEKEFVQINIYYIRDCPTPAPLTSTSRINNANKLCSKQIHIPLVLLHSRNSNALFTHTGRKQNTLK